MTEFSSWVMVELSGGGRQSLLITTGVHGEAAVTAAPVMAVGGEAEGMKKQQYMYSIYTVYMCVCICKHFFKCKLFFLIFKQESK